MATLRPRRVEYIDHIMAGIGYDGKFPKVQPTGRGF